MGNCPNCNKKLSIFKIGSIYMAEGKRFCSVKCRNTYLDNLSDNFGRGNEKPIYIAEGFKAKLLLFKNKIRIERKRGITNLSLHGLKGNKDIFLKFISAIQLKRPGVTRGYIQFSLMGGNESLGGVLSAVQDENTIMFDKKQEEDFLKIKGLIEDRINK